MEWKHKAQGMRMRARAYTESARCIVRLLLTIVNKDSFSEKKKKRKREKENPCVIGVYPVSACMHAALFYSNFNTQSQSSVAYTQHSAEIWNDDALAVWRLRLPYVRTYVRDTHTP